MRLTSIPAAALTVGLTLTATATVAPAAVPRDDTGHERSASAPAPREAARPRIPRPPMMLGPGDAGVSDIGGQAQVRKSRSGYIYISGQQSNHLRVVYIEKRDALRFRDTRTPRVRPLPKGCEKEKVARGISVVCAVPRRFEGRRSYVQVWPRLGDDYVDGRDLPGRFRLWVLADRGDDVVYGGDGADFVNGAKDDDRLYGGRGNDFLRSGPGADRVVGGAGRDRIGRS
ncbi:calcium-binding protein [Nocardioides sp.]|uniref:calcium-binding protein n=1 Tax=Nocardioides sp. TaxID=35761 RepID=UPI0035147A5E